MKNPVAEYLRLVRTIERAKREGRSSDLLKAARENAEIQKITMRPRQYAVTNGTAEIGWGTAWLCFALSHYSSVILPASPWRGRVGMLFLLGACVALPIWMWIGKQFVLRPRVGYFSFRPEKSRWISIIVAMVVAAVISIAMALWLAPKMGHPVPAPAQPAVAGAVHNHSSWLTRLQIPGYGLLNAILYLMFNAVSIKEHRWKWICFALLVTVPSVIGFLLPGNYFRLWPPVILFQGLVYLVSGVATLVWFLRRHQPIAPEAE